MTLTAARKILATAVLAVTVLAAGNIPGTPADAMVPCRAGERPHAPAYTPPADPDTVRIMPLGDSITRGIGTIPLDGYRTDLRSRLAHAGWKVDMVGAGTDGTGPDGDHEGHPSCTIADVTTIVADRLATYRPDVVLLHLGTNDMRSPAEAAAAPARMRELLATIAGNAPDAEVFVAQIIGVQYYGPKSPGAARQRGTDTLNRAIPGLVAAAGPRFHVVDMRDIGGLDLSDLVHPDRYGYLKMSWRWYQAIRRAGDPAGYDPYTATRIRRCVHSTAAPFARAALGCHLWHRAAGAWRVKTTAGWVTGW
ncbi:SGNH/GDSL hydrolase family protein [Actinoplanes couchii]|uniref:SGNH hydrolase-type esterase domain-containing protein n=1 Tax=Actinoplanes couchii TaxID=403638 RepID=A0ABQ3X7H2_9ACTN|nr:SGNH/GDSL hydrolase family protein [Actinoplanes couchii]MDR6322292.1 lysophospholipase L1-like esterase [Actinoplanes couchii]GID54451.1 hypothetical protein Aco03nite_028550 [Actinoplanes couchii]